MRVEEGHFDRLASQPVTFATAKLMPLRLRSGGTPGIGLGYPEAA